MSIPPSRASADIGLTIGRERFVARLERDLSPGACAALQALAGNRMDLIHARWSGEACWAPLAGIWPGRVLADEHVIRSPKPGQVLLYGGGSSEPELLVPYGPTRFASRHGSLAGNLVLTIEDDLERLGEVGREILWGGAMMLDIDFAERREQG